MAIIETVTTHAQATRGTMYMIGTATYIKNNIGAVTKISSGLRINSAKDDAAGITRIQDTDFVAQIVATKIAQAQAQAQAPAQVITNIHDTAGITSITTTSGIVTLNVGASSGSGNFTLAAGVIGKELTIALIARVGSVTAKITGTTPGITLITLTTPGATATLMYLSTGWHVIGSNGLTTVTLITSSVPSLAPPLAPTPAPAPTP